MNEKYKNGQTKVVVFKKENGVTTSLHKGIVVAQTNSFLRVFNPDKPNNDNGKGGDGNVQNAQWYAINSPIVSCNVVGELRVPLVLPADL